jgi:Nicotinamide mononucleotide transporter
MRYYGLNGIGTILGLASLYSLARKNKVGLVLRIAASICWVAFGVIAGTIPGVLANIAVIALSLHGMKRWNRETGRN